MLQGKIHKTWPWDEAKCFAPGPPIDSLEEIAVKQASALVIELIRRRLTRGWDLAVK